MFARFRLAALLCVISVTAPSVTHAQRTAVKSDAAPIAGPRMDLTVTAMRQIVQASDSGAALQARRQNVGKPVALMVVGGAAIVLGAVIGDEVGTLFMIGGAVTLLIGLYQYLQ